MRARSISALVAAAGLSRAFLGCSSDSPKPGSADAGPPDAGVVPACGSDVTATCPNPKPSYKRDVAPILDAQCNNCHVGGATGPWPLSPYEDLLHWRKQLLVSLVKCTMPPEDAGKTLSETERAKIIGWVACGAPNN
jgi:hypothetical protein